MEHNRQRKNTIKELRVDGYADESPSRTRNSEYEMSRTSHAGQQERAPAQHQQEHLHRGISNARRNTTTTSSSFQQQQQHQQQQQQHHQGTSLPQHMDDMDRNTSYQNHNSLHEFHDVDTRRAAESISFDEDESPTADNSRIPAAYNTTTSTSNDNHIQSTPVYHNHPRQEAIQNQNTATATAQSIEEEEKDDYHYDDEEIQKDAANELVALVVHIALGFFMLLFFGSLMAAILIVGAYGFMTFVLIISLMLMALSIGYFVSIMLDKDRVLKPVRRKIRRWHAVATAVVVQEIRDFQLDLREHLLLTNGDADEQGEGGVYNRMNDNGQVGGSASAGIRTKRKGSRSKVFGMLVKPFLKKKKGHKFRFGRKKKNENEEANDVPDDGDHEMV